MLAPLLLATALAALPAVDRTSRVPPPPAPAAAADPCDGARALPDALTRRDFAFPERSTAHVTVSVEGRRRTVELPWWVPPEAESHAMTRAWLRRTGVATTDRLNWQYDPAKDAWDRDAGASGESLDTAPAE